MEPSEILKIKLEVEDANMPLTKFTKSATMTANVESLSHSWADYPWKCCHCGASVENLEDLRSHSKEKHSLCSAFCCVDCNNNFNLFKDFIEHVRIHRDYLRHRCEFCNDAFQSKEECNDHVTVHYGSTQKICELCGEMLPYPSTLEWHKQLYGPREETSADEKSWHDYDWGCQECSLKFDDIKSLRSHVQSVHSVCFAFRCSDCPIKTRSYKNFVAHVVVHKPYLKSYCQYCNECYPCFQDMNQHIVQHITSQQRPCILCGQTFSDNIQLARHKKLYADTAPTTMKISKKTNASVTKSRKSVECASQKDLSCDFCDKVFESVAKLKKHKLTHGVRTRDFICAFCGRGFYTKSTLQDHVTTHKEKTETCKVCNKKFHTKWKLKNHLITHSSIRPFTCEQCGADFKTKRRLQSHQRKHSDVKDFKCPYCPKEFRFKENLKTHEYQHTGARPYSCEFCDRTFTNWTNCNKHMLRKHGVTLAKTKITEHGRLAINRTNGEVQKLNSDSNTKQWLSDMLKPKQRSKKTSESSSS